MSSWFCLSGGPGFVVGFVVGVCGGVGGGGEGGGRRNGNTLGIPWTSQRRCTSSLQVRRTVRFGSLLFSLFLFQIIIVIANNSEKHNCYH